METTSGRPSLAIKLLKPRKRIVHLGKNNKYIAMSNFYLNLGIKHVYF